MNIWRESDGELESYPAKKNAIVNIKAKKNHELPTKWTKLYREHHHAIPLRGGIEKLMQLNECHDTGCLGLVHWDDPEGWYGEGGGFRMGDTCIPVADSI